MSPSVETELKLACDLTALESLKTHPILVAGKERRTAVLQSTYFDVTDHSLRQAGMSLRIRSDGRASVQTLKTNDDGGLKRGEWEAAVDAAKLDLKALKKTPAAKLIKSESLEPAFTVSVERRLFLIRHGASDIEVALDSGRIVDGKSDRSEPISEVELELKDGAAADLFSLARALSADAPLRVVLKSKAERGYELADGTSGEVAKTETVPLTDDMTAAESFQAIVRFCVRHMRSNEAILLRERHVEALHQTRVAVRRLRSALSLFRPVIHDGGADRFSNRLKELIEPLGCARDLDVLLGSTLPKERKRRPDETGLLNLEKRLEVERTAAYAAVDERLKSQEWRDVFLDLLEWLDGGAWLTTSKKKDFNRLTQPAQSFAREALERRRVQVKKRGAKLDQLDDANRHGVRIAAKKLRYGSEFFAALYDGKKSSKRHEKFVSALKSLQGELGDLNDLASAGTVVTGLSENHLKGSSALFAAGVASADLDRDRADILHRARLAHTEFVDAKPFWR